jgi:hypothetical protein
LCEDVLAIGGCGLLVMKGGDRESEESQLAVFLAFPLKLNDNDISPVNNVECMSVWKHVLVMSPRQNTCMSIRGPDRISMRAQCAIVL